MVMRWVVVLVGVVVALLLAPTAAFADTDTTAATGTDRSDVGRSPTESVIDRDRDDTPDPRTPDDPDDAGDTDDPDDAADVDDPADDGPGGTADDGPGGTADDGPGGTADDAGPVTEEPDINAGTDSGAADIVAVDRDGDPGVDIHAVDRDPAPPTPAAVSPAPSDAVLPADTDMPPGASGDDDAPETPADPSAEAPVDLPADAAARAGAEVVDPAGSVSTAMTTLRAAAATDDLAGPPAQPSLLQLIGSWLFTTLSGLVRLFDPTPAIPPGSLVTRRTSPLEVNCGCGVTLDADWYFPNQDEPPTGLIYLQHGFFRSKANVSALAVHLAEQTNSLVVVPTVPSNPFAEGTCWVNGKPMHRAVAELFAGDRHALTASAELAAGHPVTLPTQYVLAGQSAGGNLAASAAAYATTSNAIAGLRAVVMFDGVDNGGGIAAGAAALTGANARPIYQIAGECGPCNAFGLGTSALLEARPDSFVGVTLIGGRHTDAEGPSSGLVGFLTCGVPRSSNVEAVRVIGAGWINDVFTGSTTGVYGAGGERIQVGAATAVVLGSGAGLPGPAVALHVGLVGTDR
ncbi:hypothetical protein ACNUDN_07245 [Mycobacterium sp. smrl_JER01]|uniref:hypothetical protein n=1 Tax=Mycobacterium sp. smrl_JER01 TaxID=3402633 RepID=UPI003AC43712